MENPFKAHTRFSDHRGEDKRQTIAEGLVDDADLLVDEEKHKPIQASLMNELKEAFDSSSHGYTWPIVHCLQNASAMSRDVVTDSDLAKLVDLSVRFLRKEHGEISQIIDCYRVTGLHPKRAILMDLFKESIAIAPVSILDALEHEECDALTEEDRSYWKTQIEVRAHRYADEKIAELERYLVAENDLPDPIGKIRQLYEKLGRSWKWSEHKQEAGSAIRGALRAGAIKYAVDIDSEKKALDETSYSLDVVRELCARDPEDVVVGAQYAHRDEFVWAFDQDDYQLTDVQKYHIENYMEVTGVAIDFKEHEELRDVVAFDMREAIDRNDIQGYIRLKELIGKDFVATGYERDQIIRLYVRIVSGRDFSEIASWEKASGISFDLGNTTIFKAILERIDHPEQRWNSWFTMDDFREEIHLLKKLAPDLMTAHQVNVLYFKWTGTKFSGNSFGAVLAGTDECQDIGVRFDGKAAECKQFLKKRLDTMYQRIDSIGDFKAELLDLKNLAPNLFSPSEITRAFFICANRFSTVSIGGMMSAVNNLREDGVSVDAGDPECRIFLLQQIKNLSRLSNAEEFNLAVSLLRGYSSELLTVDKIRDAYFQIAKYLSLEGALRFADMIKQTGFVFSVDDSGCRKFLNGKMDLLYADTVSKIVSDLSLLKEIAPEFVTQAKIRDISLRFLGSSYRREFFRDLKQLESIGFYFDASDPQCRVVLEEMVKNLPNQALSLLSMRVSILNQFAPELVPPEKIRDTFFLTASRDGLPSVLDHARDLEKFGFMFSAEDPACRNFLIGRVDKILVAKDINSYMMDVKLLQTLIPDVMTPERIRDDFFRMMGSATILDCARWFPRLQEVGFVFSAQDPVCREFLLQKVEGLADEKMFFLPKLGQIPELHRYLPEVMTPEKIRDVVLKAPQEFCDISDLLIHFKRFESLGFVFSPQDPACRNFLIERIKDLSAMTVNKQYFLQDLVSLRELVPELMTLEKINNLVLAYLDVKNPSLAWVDLLKTVGFTPDIHEPRFRRFLLNSLSRSQGAEEVIVRFKGTFILTVPELQELCRSHFSPRDLALIYQNFLPRKGKERAEAVECFTSASGAPGYIPELLQMRGPARKVEFCPYNNIVGPLFSHFSVESGDPDLRKGLFVYLRTFGFSDLPTLAHTVVDLIACEDADAHEASRKLHKSTSTYVRSALKLFDLESVEVTPQQLIEHMKVFQVELAQHVLADQSLPVGMEQNVLAMEIFNSLVPHAGQYSSVADRPDLIAEVRKNTMPEVSAFLTTRAMDVLVFGENNDADSEAIDEAIKDKCLEEPLRNFLAPWREGMALADFQQEGSRWWFGGIENRVTAFKEALGVKLETITNEKGKAAIRKQIGGLEKLLEDSARISQGVYDQENENEPDSRERCIELMRALQRLFVDGKGKADFSAMLQYAGPEAHGLMFELMRMSAPNHIQAISDAETENDPIKKLETWKTYFFEEYLEHFHRTDIADGQLPEDLMDFASALWRTKGMVEKLRTFGLNKEGAPKHDFANICRSIEALKQKKQQLINNQTEYKKEPLVLHPVMGIGRVLAGDIANACYNKHRHHLACAEYPGITALIMTLPERQAEFAGSVLCIDTRNSRGERVLVIRALNPSEVVIQRVLDPESAVLAVGEYFIESAKASAVTNPEDPVCEVRLCYDHSGGHATNRLPIFKAEGKLLEKTWTDQDSSTELVVQPETEFNVPYKIWQPGETRRIWRIPSA